MFTLVDNLVREYVRCNEDRDYLKVGEDILHTLPRQRLDLNYAQCSLCWADVEMAIQRVYRVGVDVGECNLEATYLNLYRSVMLILS